MSRYLKQKPKQLEFKFRFKEEQLDLVIGSASDKEQESRFYQTFNDLLESNKKAAKETD